MNKVVARNLSEQLVDLVRNRILSGDVSPNQPIRQDALAAELGVSKIPLREALARLDHEGLLRSQANHGFFVRALSTAEAEEVFALRLKLEPEAVALAAARADEDERRLATETLATLDRLTAEHGEGLGAHNRTFHIALIRPSRQCVTTVFLERLHVLSERYARKHLEPIGRDTRASEEHHALLDAWLARDEDKVAALTTAHIDLTLTDLRSQLSADG
jgi:DNA-binding GntR family transcriptional regulator